MKTTHILQGRGVWYSQAVYGRAGNDVTVNMKSGSTRKSSKQSLQASSIVTNLNQMLP